mgnify:CR=1 FL=1
MQSRPELCRRWMATGSRLAQRGPLCGASRSGLTIPIGTGRDGERMGMTWHLPTCCSCFLSANFLLICLCSLLVLTLQSNRARGVFQQTSQALQAPGKIKGRKCHLPSLWGAASVVPRQPAHRLFVSTSTSRAFEDARDHQSTSSARPNRPHSTHPIAIAIPVFSSAPAAPSLKLESSPARS